MKLIKLLSDAKFAVEVEDIQPVQGGVAFIFGDKDEASKMEKYLKNAGALGKVIPLRAGGGKRTMVSLRAK